MAGHGHGGGDHGHGGGHDDHGGGHGGGGGGGGAKGGGELISLIALLFIFFVVIPNIWSKITESDDVPEMPEQTFQILCKDAKGKVTKTTEAETPWKGEVCDYFEIIPDSGQVILVTLPGYRLIKDDKEVYYPENTILLEAGKPKIAFPARGDGPLRIRKP